VERRRAGIAAVSTDGGAAAIWSAAHRAVTRVCASARGRRNSCQAA
jgi:hypothetical protein